MRQHLTKSAMYFQMILFTHFRRITNQQTETLLLLSFGHLFGLYNPIQIAEALSIPKANLYRHLKGFSVYQWKSLLVRIGCSIAIQEIQETESKSASTKSRRCITISVDDTNVSRYGKLLSYCYNWWSKKHNSTIRGQNVLGITIKIGNMIIPLNIRIVGKQGRGNTDKPSLFNAMLNEVLDFFDAQGIDLRQYPITFDSWYGSQRLVQNLSEIGFDRILFHGKSNYVMDINNENIKLSQHKKQIDLNPPQWGCNKPHYRNQATSPTFGKLVILFFLDVSKIQTMLVFGKSLRSCEILRIWSQHHSIEQFWRHLKTLLKLSKMSLQPV
ncbi:hypothetical protein JT359_07135 [Candidatus Poribacteria bacterium]|nr:hypothetical protein [Candidatus Poribacteria bacterium]